MSYTVHQAKTHLSRLLKEAEAGQEVIVTRGSKPIAKIVPIEPPIPKRRVAGGFEHLPPADPSVFAPLTDEQIVECGFAAIRNGELAEPAKDLELPVSEQAG
jgi:prevent-host-death family protein